MFDILWYIVSAMITIMAAIAITLLFVFLILYLIGLVFCAINWIVSKKRRQDKI